MKILIDPTLAVLIKDFSDAQCAELLRCIFEYPNRKSDLGVWQYMKRQIEKDERKYREKCVRLNLNKVERNELKSDMISELKSDSKSRQKSDIKPEQISGLISDLKSDMKSGQKSQCVLYALHCFDMIVVRDYRLPYFQYVLSIAKPQNPRHTARLYQIAP